tara:strand:+ start:1499 stop:1933 length:435 start_codon:yes stop_codon:yes gene_type:complete
MDELLLTVGFLLQVFYLILFIIYIRNRRAKKRFKEESLNLDEGVVELDESVVEVTPVLETEELYGTTYRGWREYDNRNNPMPLRFRYGGILEEKEDFIPKKKMKYHTLEEPIFFDHSENEAEDEGCGCDTACNCYDTTDYEYPF